LRPSNPRFCLHKTADLSGACLAEMAAAGHIFWLIMHFVSLLPFQTREKDRDHQYFLSLHYTDAESTDFVFVYKFGVSALLLVVDVQSGLPRQLLI